MRLISGIRVRLALALLLVAAGALAVAYAVVVPTLEDTLIDTKLDQVEQDAAPRYGQSSTSSCLPRSWPRTRRAALARGS